MSSTELKLPDEERTERNLQSRRENLVFVCALVLLLLLLSLPFVLFWKEIGGEKRFSMDTMRVVFGIPFGAMLSILIIMIFRQAAGPIEISGFGMHFKGAAGPVILWILAFLAITGAFKMLT